MTDKPNKRGASITSDEEAAERGTSAGAPESEGTISGMLGGAIEDSSGDTGVVGSLEGESGEVSGYLGPSEEKGEVSGYLEGQNETVEGYLGPARERPEGYLPPPKPSGYLPAPNAPQESYSDVGYDSYAADYDQAGAGYEDSYAESYTDDYGASQPDTYAQTYDDQYGATYGPEDSYSGSYAGDDSYSEYEAPSSGVLEAQPGVPEPTDSYTEYSASDSYANTESGIDSMVDDFDESLPQTISQQDAENIIKRITTKKFATVDEVPKPMSTTRPKPPRSSPLTVLAIFAILGLLGAGAFIYFKPLLFNEEDTNQPIINVKPPKSAEEIAEENFRRAVLVSECIAFDVDTDELLRPDEEEEDAQPDGPGEEQK